VNPDRTLLQAIAFGLVHLLCYSALPSLGLIVGHLSGTVWGSHVRVAMLDASIRLLTGSLFPGNGLTSGVQPDSEPFHLLRVGDGRLSGEEGS
jgi:hypothetical protein